MNILKNLRIILLHQLSLLNKTLHYHWNIEGSNFAELHEMLEKQYKEIFESIDTVAERMRALDSTVSITHQNISEEQKFSNPDVSQDWQNMISDLFKDHKTFITLLKEGIAVCQNQEDFGTEDLFIKLLRYHEKHVWMLMAVIK